MPELVIDRLSRRFAGGGGVDEVSFTVESGEFFVLLGPSGCGKSTLLRLLAGLDRSDRGSIEFNHREGSGSERATVAMVFQNYALYPHMSAFDNIAFPLKLAGVARDEIARRVSATSRTVGLQTDLRRRPAELSGGERQRVALARALIREPRMILMDEPLSNLDAALRSALRVELKDFQRRTGRTIIYVTHDQVEALTLADRIAVMRAGRVLQVDTPQRIYDGPANRFVASFVGQPPMNLLECPADPARHAVVLDGAQIRCATELPGGQVVLGIRPADISFEPAAVWPSLEVTVEQVEFVGGRSVVRARTATHSLIIETTTPVRADQRRSIYLDPARVHLFDASSGSRID